VLEQSATVSAGAVGDGQCWSCRIWFCVGASIAGNSKWNFVVQGRILAMLFDKRKLFGQQAIEKFDETYWGSSEVRRPRSGSPPLKKLLTKQK
jgi:hypothetical protein